MKKVMPQLNISELIINLHPEIWGDFKWVIGDVSKIYGCISKLKGNVTGLEGDVTDIAGNVSNVFGKIPSGCSGDVSRFQGDITGSKEFKKCAVCKEVGPIVFRNKRGRFCRDCYAKVCVECKKELSDVERNRIEKFGDPWDSERLCLECYLEKLKVWKEKEIKLAIQHLEMQLSSQICDCGKLNDSRDKNGDVCLKYCQACRKQYGERKAIDNILMSIATKKERDPDKKKVVFSRTVGFKERE